MGFGEFDVCMLNQAQKKNDAATGPKANQVRWFLNPLNDPPVVTVVVVSMRSLRWQSPNSDDEVDIRIIYRHSIDAKW